MKKVINGITYTKESLETSIRALEANWIDFGGGRKPLIEDEAKRLALIKQNKKILKEHFSEE